MINYNNLDIFFLDFDSYLDTEKNIESQNSFEIAFKNCVEAIKKKNLRLLTNNLFNDLVKFTNPWKSYITGDVYQGLVVNTETEGLMRAIIKEKMND